MKFNVCTIFFILFLFFTSTILLTTVYGEISMDEFTSFNKPVGLAWINGEFIVSSQNGDTHLLKVSRDGQTIEPFAPSFSGEGEVYIALSHGKAGFPEGYIYVSSGNSIYEIDSSGNEVRLFSTPFEAMGLGYIAFDTIGTWNNLLYAVNFNGLLWAIDSNGDATLVLDLGNDLLPESIDVAPIDFGDFGGDLLIALEMDRKIIAISDENLSQITVLLEFDGESPERVLVIPAESDLFIAKYEENSVVKLSANLFSNYVGGLVVITEGEYGEEGSITFLEADENVIVVTPVVGGIENPHFEGAVFVSTTVIETITIVENISTLTQTDMILIGFSIITVLVLIVVVIRIRKKPKLP